ncbi:hypothetical protein AVEN_247970-1 [Araneus ventricosus]|uniref:Uncharacterized protein n=1 Tax=Araneus ventricosus TaxID=182803 RepID=A0A4Y2CIB1_ARAVE|nr:hypothetical protein AVEN_247970-1 [Araneus ventricosus]
MPRHDGVIISVTLKFMVSFRLAPLRITYRLSPRDRWLGDVITFACGAQRCFYVLIFWTLEVVRKRGASLGGIVKRCARFSTGTAVDWVFSESEKIGREGPVLCDKLDELSRPIMISKSYLLYDFICGVAIGAIIPTPLPLSQESRLNLKVLECRLTLWEENVQAEGVSVSGREC